MTFIRFIALVAAASLPAVALTIDDFSTSQTPAVTGIGNFAAGGDILGGERDVNLADGISFEATGGEATIVATSPTGTGVSSFAFLLYDGSDASNVASLGLGGAAVDEGGLADRFLLDLLEISGTTLSTILRVEIYETINDGAGAQVDLPFNVSTPTTIEIPFASFSPFGLGGDFNSVEQINLSFSNLVDGQRIVFDNFRTGTAVGPTVPEPGTVLLLGLGLLGMAAVRRKR